MSDIPENQIESWLKKLERESWQLELLVSAFTIFLLIGANSQFDEFIRYVQYEYNLNGSLSIAFVFLLLIQKSILALTICLIVHLMLRGFWIGAIGLRSVQSTIDFKELNYNEFFTDRLKKKVISLDRMVIMLDEICSVIFAFSFLIISILLAFGMFLTFLAVTGFLLSTIISALPNEGIVSFVGVIVGLLYVFFVILAGLIYMIDYFTLGFFKKIKWFSKVYYPFYRLYNFITLSKLSRSIYYYLISKFSKKKIRMVYAVVGFSVVLMMLFSFDQYQYFPGPDTHVVSANYYDDIRSEEQYISAVSLESRFIDKHHFQFFLRYDPRDNGLIAAQCPDYEPIKDDGLNFKLGVKADGANFQITGIDYSTEDHEKLLQCQQSIYQISVNDSVYTDLKYHFYVHPDKKQKGLLATIPTDSFLLGENSLGIKKVSSDSTKGYVDFVSVPFWFNPN